MYVNSIYNKMIQSGDELLNIGYDYNTNGLFERFFSSRMYMNPRTEEFLNGIEPTVIEFTESVKKIQFYTNFTIDKNERRINI